MKTLFSLPSILKPLPDKVSSSPPPQLPVEGWTELSVRGILTTEEPQPVPRDGWVTDTYEWSQRQVRLGGIRLRRGQAMDG